MSDIKLSKDNNLLICTLYKSYLQQVKDSSSKSISRQFGSSDELQETLFPTWSKDDVATACWELHSKGLLNCQAGDDIANYVYITEEGIIYMQNHKLNTIKEIADFIDKIKP